jgi:thioredoxin reductase
MDSPFLDLGPAEVAGLHICCSRLGGDRTRTISDSSVELDIGGYIRTDDELSTNVANIWALGDCNGRGAFTHYLIQRF